MRKALDQHRAQARPHRFNGASTFRLRKGLRPSTGLPTPKCFNGAATFRLRKGPARRRPRHKPPLLQWGRNLSVAEGRSDRQRGRGGPGFNGAATFRLRKEPDARAHKSDRHSFNGAATFRLRKGEAIRDAGIARQASMGPQPFGCGRPPTEIDVDEKVKVLQWGRNLSVAEGLSGAAYKLPRRQLQWGRNLSVAEGYKGTGIIPAIHGFNGAATFRLRKGDGAPPRTASTSPLQWGRNLSVAEGRRRGRHVL